MRAAYHLVARTSLVWSSLPDAGGGHDLVPTFFAQAGIDLPWEMHGRDLTPLLEHPDMASDHAVLMAYTGYRFGSQTSSIPPKSKHGSGYPWWVSYRQHHYKYIRHLLADEIEELYDLRADPDELRNLALLAEQQQQLQHFREATLAELRRTGAPFLDALPPWRQGVR